MIYGNIGKFIYKWYIVFVFKIEVLFIFVHAFANDGEGGGGVNNLKKCGQGNISFTPAHGATACIYCGDCLAHWVFVSYEGECKLF